MRVLVVEDERFMADAIATGLRREGAAVDVAYDGREALEKVDLTVYDVVVLDRDLPLVHGDDVCRAIVEAGHGTRVLMLTAAAEIADLVGGLDLGADDYLAKPFAFDELTARLRALARRSPHRSAPTIVVGDLALNSVRHTATRGGRELGLTRKEFAVLEVLARQPGHVVSAEDLLERAWDEHVNPFTNVIRVTMVGLRRKLGDPAVIDTVTGVGYRLRPSNPC